MVFHRGKVFGAPGGKVIDHHHRFFIPEESFDEVRSNETSTAGNEDVCRVSHPCTKGGVLSPCLFHGRLAYFANLIVAGLYRSRYGVRQRLPVVHGGNFFGFVGIG